MNYFRKMVAIPISIAATALARPKWTDEPPLFQ
jgi:hypothetical protein